jgi:hypothetical protein
MGNTADFNRLVRRQHGVFTRRDALEAGFSPSGISRRLAAGTWILLGPQVYAVATAPLTTERQYKAAQLSLEGAGLCGLAAAAHHGFDGFGVVRAEISVPLGSTNRTRLATVHRWKVLPKFTVVRGVRVTTVAQTLLDVAGRVDEARLERAMDGQLLTGEVTVAALEERVRAYDGTRRAGLPVFRDLVAERGQDAYQPPESELESALVRLVRVVFQRDEYVLQPDLPWRPPGAGRIDVYFPHHWGLAEGDSGRWHARVHDFDRDAQRRNEAALHGIVPLTFTWRMITQRASVVVDQLERLKRNAERRRAG